MSLPEVTTSSGIRDRAILETLYSTGIGRAELVNLGLYDIQADQGTLMVRLGKGRKDRVVPIGERALGWIDKYLVEVRPTLVVEPDCGALFISHFGEAFSPHWVTDIVRTYVEKAAIGKRGGCHLFRHTSRLIGRAASTPPRCGAVASRPASASCMPLRFGEVDGSLDGRLGGGGGARRASATARARRLGLRRCEG